MALTYNEYFDINGCPFSIVLKDKPKHINLHTVYHDWDYDDGEFDEEGDFKRLSWDEIQNIDPTTLNANDDSHDDYYKYEMKYETLPWGKTLIHAAIDICGEYLCELMDIIINGDVIERYKWESSMNFYTYNTSGDEIEISNFDYSRRSIYDIGRDDNIKSYDSLCCDAKTSYKFINGKLNDEDMTTIQCTDNGDAHIYYKKDGKIVREEYNDGYGFIKYYYYTDNKLTKIVAVRSDRIHEIITIEY